VNQWASLSSDDEEDIDEENDEYNKPQKRTVSASLVLVSNVLWCKALSFGIGFV